jgi:Tetratricopeptide repeat
LPSAPVCINFVLQTNNLPDMLNPIKIGHPPIDHYNLGRTQQLQGHKEQAVGSYRKALQLNPEHELARRNLATLLTQLGRREESAFLFYQEMLVRPQCADWMKGLIAEAIKDRRFYLAGEYAAILADLQSPGAWPGTTPGTLPPLPVQTPPIYLSIEFDAIIKDYQEVLDYRPSRRTNAPIQSGSATRIVHLRETPPIHQPFSTGLTPRGLQRQYLEPGPGIIVIDNFLSAEAPVHVHHHRHEPILWPEGSHCPLLFRIIEGLRHSLPHTARSQYPVRQLWNKPDDPNLDDTCGGLDIFTINEPLDWDYHAFNGRPELIVPFLQMQNAHRISIPYRQNRAIILNPDFFRGISELKFHRGQANNRINITMLYDHTCSPETGNKKPKTHNNRPLNGPSNIYMKNTLSV